MEVLFLSPAEVVSCKQYCTFKAKLMEVSVWYSQNNYLSFGRCTGGSMLNWNFTRCVVHPRADYSSIVVGIVYSRHHNMIRRCDKVSTRLPQPHPRLHFVFHSAGICGSSSLLKHSSQMIWRNCLCSFFFTKCGGSFDLKLWQEMRLAKNRILNEYVNGYTLFPWLYLFV